MTTIAFDGKTIAADSQESAGTMIVSLQAEKLFVDGRFKINGRQVLCVGMAGDSAAEEALKNALITDMDFMTDFPEDDEFSAIAVVGVNECYVIHKDEKKVRAQTSFHKGSYGVGSGGQVAMTAMHMGASAAEAVRVAIDLDIYTGGTVAEVNVPWG